MFSNNFIFFLVEEVSENCKYKYILITLYIFNNYFDKFIFTNYSILFSSEIFLFIFLFLFFIIYNFFCFFCFFFAFFFFFYFQYTFFFKLFFFFVLRNRILNTLSP